MISKPLHIACAIAFTVDGLMHAIPMFQGFPEAAGFSWAGMAVFLAFTIVCPVSAVLVLKQRRFALWPPAVFPIVGGTILLLGSSFPGLHIFANAPGDFHSAAALPALTPVVLLTVVSGAVSCVSAIVLLLGSTPVGEGQ